MKKYTAIKVDTTKDGYYVYTLRPNANVLSFTSGSNNNLLFDVAVHGNGTSFGISQLEKEDNLVCFSTKETENLNFSVFNFTDPTLLSHDSNNGSCMFSINDGSQCKTGITMHNVIYQPKINRVNEFRAYQSYVIEGNQVTQKKIVLERKLKKQHLPTGQTDYDESELTDCNIFFSVCPNVKHPNKTQFVHGKWTYGQDVTLEVPKLHLYKLEKLITNLCTILPKRRHNYNYDDSDDDMLYDGLDDDRLQLDGRSSNGFQHDGPMYDTPLTPYRPFRPNKRNPDHNNQRHDSSEEDDFDLFDNIQFDCMPAAKPKKKTKQETLDALNQETVYATNLKEGKAFKLGATSKSTLSYNYEILSFIGIKFYIVPMKMENMKLTNFFRDGDKETTLFNKTCVICIEDFQIGESVFMNSPCNHLVLHTKCCPKIDHSSKDINNADCYVCRTAGQKSELTFN